MFDESAVRSHRQSVQVHCNQRSFWLIRELHPRPCIEMDMLFWFGVVTTSNQENEHVRLAFVSGVGDSRLPNGRVREAGRECVCGLHQAAGKRDPLSPVWIERGGARSEQDAFVSGDPDRAPADVLRSGDSAGAMRSL